MMIERFGAPQQCGGRESHGEMQTEKGGIKAGPQPPYLSPINNEHVDLVFSRPAKRRAVGMATIETELVLERGEVETQQTW
ncbi:hypothetical protein CYMTET_23720 [Cymbomonas tetramitiformis]|uniref:Uncharacterized protein n=1 Tax=Cymbomonas tetramitiformis TaxID=36881 RepID=A0AAE0FXE9_9CHLO|nr:hypothetical protein CYMTET_23720 [Cymbomonas tetramitiformis]